MATVSDTDLVRRSLLELLARTAADGSLEKALHDAHVEKVEEPAQPPTSPTRRPSYEAIQAARKAGAGVGVSDLLAEFQEELSGSPQGPAEEDPAEVSFDLSTSPSNEDGGGGFFISAGGGGLNLPLEEDDALKEDEDLTAATRRIYLSQDPLFGGKTPETPATAEEPISPPSAPPEQSAAGDEEAEDPGSPSGEAAELPAAPAEPEACSSQPPMQEAAPVTDAEPEKPVVEAPPAQEEVSPEERPKLTQDIKEEVLLRLHDQLLAKQAVMQNVLRGLLNSQVRAARKAAQDAQGRLQLESKETSSGDRPEESAAGAASSAVPEEMPEVAQTPSGNKKSPRGGKGSAAGKRNRKTSPSKPQLRNTSSTGSIGSNGSGTSASGQKAASPRSPRKSPQRPSKGEGRKNSSNSMTSSPQMTPRRPSEQPGKSSPRNSLGKGGLAPPAQPAETGGESSSPSRPSSQPSSRRCSWEDGVVDERTEVEGEVTLPEASEATVTQEEWYQEEATTSGQDWQYTQEQPALPEEPDMGVCEVSEAEFQLLFDAGMLYQAYGYGFPMNQSGFSFNIPGMPVGQQQHPQAEMPAQEEQPMQGQLSEQQVAYQQQLYQWQQAQAAQAAQYQQPYDAYQQQLYQQQLYQQQSAGQQQGYQTADPYQQQMFQNHPPAHQRPPSTGQAGATTATAAPHSQQAGSSSSATRNVRANNAPTAAPRAESPGAGQGGTEEGDAGKPAKEAEGPPKEAPTSPTKATTRKARAKSRTRKKELPPDPGPKCQLFFLPLDTQQHWKLGLGDKKDAMTHRRSEASMSQRLMSSASEASQGSNHTAEPTQDWDGMGFSKWESEGHGGASSDYEEDPEAAEEESAAGQEMAGEAPAGSAVNSARALRGQRTNASSRSLSTPPPGAQQRPDYIPRPPPAAAKPGRFRRTNARSEAGKGGGGGLLFGGDAR